MKWCEDINIPLAPKETQGPAQILIFLGIEGDTVGMQAKLPQDKLLKRRKNIQQLLLKRVKHIRLLRLQSVIGLLNFACRVKAPGRAFLRRLVDLTQQGNRPSFHETDQRNHRRLQNMASLLANGVAACQAPTSTVNAIMAIAHVLINKKVAKHFTI